MKFIIRRALWGLLFTSIGLYAGYWSIKLMDIQMKEAIQTHSVDWRYGFAAMVLLGVALSFVALGVLMNFPRAMRWIMDKSRD